MNKPHVVEEWHNEMLSSGPKMKQAIEHTIRMIGPGYLRCLVCDDLTHSRGIYIPVDHREDLGNGAHFENMVRIFSFALCKVCGALDSQGDRVLVRDQLKKAVKESMKDNPETIQ